MTEKHALFFVPNYDGSTGARGASKTHPVSYLRLGSMVTSPPSLSTAELRGDDLLERAGARPSSPANVFFDEQNGGTSRNQTGAGTSYYRKDGPGAATASDTTTLTAQLMTRGGWRDHTDGNRVSTTRGDRVDFVYGNYKRVVLGRAAPSVAASSMDKSYWESSGGHNDDYTTTPGDVVSISWVQTQGGTWKVVEERLSCNKIERFSGRSYDYFDGDVIQSTTGVAHGSPSMSAADAGLLVGCMGSLVTMAVGAKASTEAGTLPPVAVAICIAAPLLGLVIGAILDKSYVTADDSESPIIREEVYATSIESVVEADSISDTSIVQSVDKSVTHLGGSLVETKRAATLSDSTGALGHEVVFKIDRLIATHVQTETTFDQRHLLGVGLVSVSLSLVAAELHYYGNRKDGPFGPSFPAFNLGIWLGAKRDTALGLSAEFFLGTKLAFAIAHAAVCELAAKAELIVAFDISNDGESTRCLLNEQRATLARIQAETQAIRLSGGALH